MNNKLLLLEVAVLKKLLYGPLPELITLFSQIELCTVEKRELTGFGFYTTFAVPPNIPRKPGYSLKFGDVVGEIEGLRDGAGFLLYVKDGVLDMLEGYSYDQPWPPLTDVFKLSYSQGIERNWAALKAVLLPKA